LPTSNPSAVSTSSPGPSSLSTGAKAGIGIGAALAALAIAGILGFWLLHRRRKRKTPDVTSVEAKDQAQWNAPNFEMGFPAELPGHQKQVGSPAELSGEWEAK